MASYVDATHNVEFILNKDQWNDDLDKSAAGDITGYQEAGAPKIRAVLKQHCIDHGRTLYHPLRCGNPISWKPELFTPVKVDKKFVRGVITAHPSAIVMGIDVKYNPSRDIVYVGLTHKPTGKKVLRINVHPTAGATKPEMDADNLDSNELSIWKDWSIGQYWLDILSFAAGQMSLQDPGRTTTANFWDVLTLGGDYNGALVNDDRWYYPGALLPALFEPDEQMRGIDHLQHGHGSDVRSGKRWAEEAHSDHNIHLVERTFLNVPDFQRQF